MIEVNLVVPDDTVIKIGNVKGTIGPKLQVYRPKPWITWYQKIRFFAGTHARTLIHQLISIDAASHDVAAEGTISIDRRKRRVLSQGNPANSSRIVQMIHHLRNVSKPITGLAKTVMMSTGNHQIDGFGMTVGGKNVAM